MSGLSNEPEPEKKDSPVAPALSWTLVAPWASHLTVDRISPGSWQIKALEMALRKKEKRTYVWLIRNAHLNHWALGFSLVQPGGKRVHTFPCRPSRIRLPASIKEQGEATLQNGQGPLHPLFKNQTSDFYEKVQDGPSMVRLMLSYFLLFGGLRLTC